MAFNSVGSVPPLVSQRTSVVAPASAAARRSRERVGGVVAEAVEVVLGVEDHLFAGVGQIRDGVAHGLEVLLRRGPQDLLDVQLPALGDDAGDGRGEGGEERDRGILLRPSARPPGPREGDEPRVRERGGVEALEELEVFGVRGGEARFDVVDPQGVELAGYAGLVLGGQAHALALGSVA